MKSDIKNSYREKIDCLSELEDRGLCIIKDENITMENHLEEILIKKGLSPSDLAKITGIPRQNINSVIRNNMKPGADFIAKVLFVLNISFSELFTLPDSAWVKPYKHDDKTTLYIDVINLEIIDTSTKKEIIKQTGNEYYDTNEKVFLSKKQRDSLLKEYINDNKEDKINDILKNDKMNLKTAESIAIEELKKEFNDRYTKIYYKLGERITPYILKK